MVNIKILFIVIFIFVSKQASASQNISIIRDAEIEFFLHKIIQTTLDEKLKNNSLLRIPLPKSNLKHAWYKFNCFIIIYL